MRIIRVFFLLAIVFVGLANADTTWVAAGSITGSWSSENSPYMIQGAVTVPAGDSLRIESGVTVFFTGTYRFTVNGILRALGTEEDSIRFTTDTLANPGRWRGIRFLGSGSTASYLGYCVIEHGRAGGNGDDRYGGGIECQQSSPSIQNTAIRYCFAALDGGAIYCRENSNPSLYRCELSNNRTSSGSGGAMLCRSSDPNIISCNIHDNTSGLNGGALAFLLGSQGNVIDCIIRNNHAVLGGGITLPSNTSVAIVEGCEFIGNTALQSGAAIYSVSGHATVSRCRFDGNAAPLNGGAVSQLSDAIGEYSNCLFTHNSAAAAGGAIYSSSNASLRVLFCTLFGNSSPVGGGIRIFESQPLIRSSIFSFSPAGEAINMSDISAGEISYCCFYGNAGGSFGGEVPPEFGVVDTVNLNGDSCDLYHNLYSDPAFADTGAGNFALSDSSPCIEAGLDAGIPEDYNESPRPDPVNTQPDMGCFESSFTHGFQYACGEIRGVWGPGLIRVGCDIYVGADEILVIRPGTQFLFTGPFSLTVNGTLQALGTAEDSIRFQRYDENNEAGWRGIRFINSGPNCLMVYCVIQGAHGEGFAQPDGCGGVYCSNGSPRFEHCSIRNNVAEFRGGGVACYSGSNPVFANCTISNNAVFGDMFMWGGGIYAVASSPTFTACIVDGNHANTSGGGLYSETSQVAMNDCVISNNTAESAGGGIFCLNGTPVLNSTEIAGNAARDGGGMCLRARAQISNCIIHNNTATNGGGVNTDWQSASLTHCVIYDNSGDAMGGGFYCHTSNPSLTNCTIGHNMSPLGAGMYVANATPTINSSLIAFSTGGGIYFVNAAGATIRYSDCFGNSNGDFVFAGSDSTQGPPGLARLTQTNVNNDPCDTYYNILLDPLIEDEAARDYHLEDGSPCILAGDPSLPHDPDGTIADIGAYSAAAPFHIPEPFNLISPQNNDTLDGVQTFCWEASHDSDAGDTVTYTISFVTEDTTFMRYVGQDTCIDLNLTTMPLAGSSQVTWYITAHCQFPDSFRSSNNSRFFNYMVSQSGPSAFNLVFPTDGQGMPYRERFCWNRSIDPDSGDTVDYRIIFTAGDETYVSITVNDTCLDILRDDLPFTPGDTATWYVLAHSQHPDIFRPSNTSRTIRIPPVAVDIPDAVLPATFALHAAYPNPFNAVTVISFSVPHTAMVSIRVFDIMGRECGVLQHGSMAAGRYSASWNASELGSGIYFCRMESEGFAATRKLILLK